MKMQERKVREERTPRNFYISSLKPELHPVCQGNLSLTLHYFKRFTKYPSLLMEAWSGSVTGISEHLMESCPRPSKRSRI